MGDSPPAEDEVTITSLRHNGSVDARKANSTWGAVSPEECAELRRVLAAGSESVRDVGRALSIGVKYASLRHHALGECMHSHGVPAVEYNNSAGQWVSKDDRRLQR